MSKSIKFSGWIVLNSLSAFLVSAILGIFLYFFTQALVAKIIGVDSILYFGELKILTPAESWNKLKVLIVYGFPLFFSFVLILVSYQLYIAFKRTNSIIKLYFLWFHVFSVSMFCGSLIHGIAVYKGLAVIIRWLSMPTVINVIFGLIGLIILGVWGSFWSKFFVKMCPSQRYEVHLNPKLFLLQVAVIPTVVGSIGLGLFLMRATSIPIIIFMSGIVLMMIVATLLKESSFEKTLLVKNFPLDHFLITPLVMLLIFLAAARYLAYSGIEF